MARLSLNVFCFLLLLFNVFLYVYMTISEFLTVKYVSYMLIILFLLSFFLFGVLSRGEDFKKVKHDFLLIFLFAMLIFIYIVDYIIRDNSIYGDFVFDSVRVSIQQILFFIVWFYLFSRKIYQNDGVRFFLVFWSVLFIACFLNVMIDFFCADCIYISSDYKIPGRAAGVFLNPNIAAESLLVSMIALISLADKKYSGIIFFFGVLGCILTFSRGAIGICAILFLIFVVFRVLSYKFVLSFVMVAPFFITTVLMSFQDYIPSESAGVLERLLSLTGQADWRNESSDSRFDVVNLAWNLFWESPIVGNGNGSVYQFGSLIGTHNIYLRFLSDFGFLGFFIYLALIWRITYIGFAFRNPIVVSFFIYFLCWGFFSHNTLETFTSIVGLSYMAVYARYSLVVKRV